MVNSSTSIVLLGSNRDRVGSTGRGRYSSSSLISTDVRTGASVVIMSLLSTVVVATISS
jgi:UDP-N-acetylglucosamine enolpyruvyl transferase